MEMEYRLIEYYLLCSIKVIWFMIYFTNNLMIYVDYNSSTTNIR
jgi:hypothetical protein